MVFEFESVLECATRDTKTVGGDDDREITVDVGDVTFFVPRSVLTAIDNFFVHVSADTITVNRTPTVFHIILRYLRAARDGCVPECLDALTGLTARERAMVLSEADFYGLRRLRDFVLYDCRITQAVVNASDVAWTQNWATHGYVCYAFPRRSNYRFLFEPLRRNVRHHRWAFRFGSKNFHVIVQTRHGRKKLLSLYGTSLPVDRPPRLSGHIGDRDLLAESEDLPLNSEYAPSVYVCLVLFFLFFFFFPVSPTGS
jgi:hypothetical protein